MSIWIDGIERYPGAVLRTEHRQIWFYDPISTTYAEVWLPDEGRIDEVMVSGDMYAGYRYEIDATPEVRALAADWYAVDAVRVARESAISEWRASVIDAYTPHKGARAAVVRGRKVPVGTEGEIIWTGDGPYGERVGLRDDAGNVHWTAIGNVRVIDPAPRYEPEPLASFIDDDIDYYEAALPAAYRRYGLGR